MTYFLLTTLTTLLLFIWAVKPAYRFKLMLVLLAWLLLQGLFAFNGFFLVTDGTRPRFVFAVLPPVLLIVFLMVFRWKRIADTFNAERLTYLHIVRIPVEIAIFSWYTQGLVPKLMTFEGINFDILSGLTAFFIAFAYFRKNWISTTVYKTWNFICLGLLLNIVINAIGSAQTPLQFQAFKQPNIAVMYFPYSFLPSFIVPAVLFAHLYCLRTKHRYTERLKDR
jgi:hypothetical protein